VAGSVAGKPDGGKTADGKTEVSNAEVSHTGPISATCPNQ